MPSTVALTEPLNGVPGVWGGRKPRPYGGRYSRALLKDGEGAREVGGQERKGAWP